MIKKKEQCAVEHKAHAFGAEGNIHICSLVSGRGELNEKGRAFAHTSVDVGAGIGYHEKQNGFIFFPARENFVTMAHGSLCAPAM